MSLTFKNIHFFKHFEFNQEILSHKPFEVSELFNDESRTFIEIKISDGEILKKHKANVPISILCLSGSGICKAGENLEDEINLKPATLLALDANVPHEIIATPKIKFLLTKFKTNSEKTV
ncbi:MAG: hypothetical protein MUC29_02290 [Pyrinomonadaceae bacterium]|jgi:quercetin dioxygenase-like cupin family protein|nr:hypothetical protein [Pyrinomonadaceae bacterium]